MGPSFRGEESRSRRHLMEYHHIKAEIAFTDLEDIIRIVEELISYTTKHCWNKASHLMEQIGTTMCLDGLRTPFARIFLRGRDQAPAVEWVRDRVWERARFE